MEYIAKQCQYVSVQFNIFVRIKLESNRIIVSTCCAVFKIKAHFVSISYRYHENCEPNIRTQTYHVHNQYLPRYTEMGRYINSIIAYKRTTI